MMAVMVGRSGDTSVQHMPRILLLSLAYYVKMKTQLMLPTCLILAQGEEPLRNQSQLGKELVSCLTRCYVCNKKRVGNTAPTIYFVIYM